MPEWNVFGRGFDSRRLHQPTFEAKLKTEAAAPKLVRAKAGFSRFQSQIASNFGSARQLGSEAKLKTEAAAP